MAQEGVHGLGIRPHTHTHRHPGEGAKGQGAGRAGPQVSRGGLAKQTRSTKERAARWTAVRPRPPGKPFWAAGRAGGGLEPQP